MANSCLHILSKKEYTATRCQDGILLFWPIEGSMHFQQFMKERILSDELYIVNNMDVFSISDNGITLEVYSFFESICKQEFAISLPLSLSLLCPYQFM